MKTLRILYAHFLDECQGVEEYIGDAFTAKAKDKELADAYAKMASMEHEHAVEIHKQMCRIMDGKLKAKDLPQWACDIWDDLQHKMVKDLNKAKNYLDMYKG